MNELLLIRGKIRERLARASQNGFVRNVGLLAGSTALAQALTVLVLPILTRLYKPEDFNVLATYTALLAITSVSACLRFEFAIPMPAREKDASNLLALSIFSASLVSILIWLVVLIFPKQIIGLVKQPALYSLLWLVPVGTWFMGVFSALQFWSTRKRQFPLIAGSRLAQSAGGAVTQISAGIGGLTPSGLIFGQVMNNAAGVATLAYGYREGFLKIFLSVKISRMKRVIHTYKRFPTYAALDGLANNIGIQLPVIMIAALAIGPEAGYLMLATRVMTMPMILVGSSVAQVYLAHAPTASRDGKLSDFTADVIIKLVKTGVGPLIFAGIVSPILFPLIFGAAWQRAGYIVAWVTPWCVFQFLSSPISMVMHVRNKQQIMLSLTVLGVVLRVGSLALASIYSKEYLSEIYAFSGLIFYMICYFVYSKVAGISATRMCRLLYAGRTMFIFWVVAGIALHVAYWAVEYK